MRHLIRLVLIAIFASLLVVPFAAPGAAYPGSWTDPDDVATPLDLKSGSHNDDVSIFEFVVQTYGNWPNEFADLFGWYMDTSGDGLADYGVFVYWNGTALVGQVETPTSIIGSASVSRPASNALRVTFNRSTIGNPNGFLYQGFSWFDTNGNGIDEDNEVDATNIFFHDAPIPNSLSLTPSSAASSPFGTCHTVTALVRDQENQPMPNVLVRFSVSGANSVSGAATTDSNGNASFTYTGLSATTDTINAFADFNKDGSNQGAGSGEPGNSATKSWTAGSLPPDQANVQYMPEGATHSGFSTFVLLANPSTTQTVDADLTFLTNRGPVAPPSVQNVSIAPQRRKTISVDQSMCGVPVDVATKVTSDQQVLAEVSIHKSGSLANMDMVAAPAVSTSWILPEGATHSGFTTFVTIANPNTSSPTHVDIDYLTKSGGTVDANDALTIPAGQRVTLNAGSAAPNGCNCADDVSTKITVLGAEPGVVAGVSVHRQTDDLGIGGSLGVTGTADTWVVAEGSTAFGWNTFVLIANPGGGSATVSLTYLTGSQGPVNGGSVAIPAGSRRTLHVNQELANLGKAPDDVSTVVDSTTGTVAVESSVQKSDGSGLVIADSVGASGSSVTSTAHTDWLAAEGATHSGFSTFISIANPNPSNSATVQLTLLTPTGTISGPSINVPAGSRRTVSLNAFFPGQDLSTLVHATSGSVVVEMSIDRISGGFAKGRSLAQRI